MTPHGVIRCDILKYVHNTEYCPSIMYHTYVPSCAYDMYLPTMYDTTVLIKTEKNGGCRSLVSIAYLLSMYICLAAIERIRRDVMSSMALHTFL